MEVGEDIECIDWCKMTVRNVACVTPLACDSHHPSEQREIIIVEMQYLSFPLYTTTPTELSSEF